jgi:hypothetical protein
MSLLPLAGFMERWLCVHAQEGLARADTWSVRGSGRGRDVGPHTAAAPFCWWLRVGGVRVRSLFVIHTCGSRAICGPRSACVCSVRAVVVTALCLCPGWCLLQAMQQAGLAGNQRPGSVYQGVAIEQETLRGPLVCPSQGPCKCTGWAGWQWGLCCSPGCMPLGRAPGVNCPSLARPIVAAPCRRPTTCQPNRHWGC